MAFSHLVWNLTSDSGGGPLIGVLHLIVFTIPALAIALLGRWSRR